MLLFMNDLIMYVKILDRIYREIIKTKPVAFLYISNENY